MAFLDKTGITTLVNKLRSVFIEKGKANKFVINPTYSRGIAIATYYADGDDSAPLYTTNIWSDACFARVASNKSNTANVTSSPTLAITRQNTQTGQWTLADNNTSLVCPYFGEYEVSGAITWNPSSSGTWLVTFVMGIGGTDYTAYATSTSGTRVTAVISPTIVDLSANQKIDIRVTVTGAGTIQSGNSLSRIAIRRIR